MRLTDLDPRWLLKDGARVGFVFRSPTNPRFHQSCFFAPTPFREQCKLFVAALGGDEEDAEFGRFDVQPCNDGCAWRCTPSPDAAVFSEISIEPSLDGSAGGLWHGFITNGVIVGGI
jgi:hypothetical protein